MKLPGVGNLLSMAQRLVGPDPLQLRRYVGTAPDGAGIKLPVYDQPFDIQGNAQPVDRKVYQDLGLDLQKDYITVYTSATLRDLKRDKAPDQVLWAGQSWTVESNKDWKDQNGWAGSLCVAVGKTPL